MKQLRSEEEIKARLRELTRDTNRVRRELERIVAHEPDRSRPFTHDLKYKLTGSEHARVSRPRRNR